MMLRRRNRKTHFNWGKYCSIYIDGRWRTENKRNRANSEQCRLIRGFLTRLSSPLNPFALYYCSLLFVFTFFSRDRWAFSFFRFFLFLSLFEDGGCMLMVFIDYKTLQYKCERRRRRRKRKNTRKVWRFALGAKKKVKTIIRNGNDNKIKFRQVQVCFFRVCWCLFWSLEISKLKMKLIGKYHREGGKTHRNVCGVGKKEKCRRWL